MQLRSNEEILNECDRLGEAAVEDRLANGDFSDNPTPAREWLMTRRLQSAQHREGQSVRHTLWALWASWVLVLITFLGLWWQKQDALEQRKLLQEQIAQQQRDSAKQRADAQALLDVQMSDELDKQFDSPEMRQARRRLSAQLLHGNTLTETRVIDFFEKVAMYMHQHHIKEDTVYQSYSYWVERYWPAVEKYVKKFRRQENDEGFYGNFEDLYKRMLVADGRTPSRAAGRAPSKEEVQRFLREEATLPFLREAQLPQ